MKWKPLLGILIIALTIGLFVNFFSHHPELLRQLGALRWPIVAGLLGLYLLTPVPLALILFLTLALCGQKLPFKELLLVTGYSTILNFFGPLQSGPVFRAVYLKTKHGVSLKSYTLATLLYYAVLAVVSGLWLFLGSQWWWLGLLAAAIITTLSAWYYQRQRRKGGQVQFRWKVVAALIAATLLQVVLLTLIYFIELKVVSSPVYLAQAVSYTGAANFSLFVALTPGAIGIREAFLLLSQQLHGLGENIILTASLIDRAVYVAFLLLLFAASLVTHAGDRFKVVSAPKPAGPQ